MRPKRLEGLSPAFLVLYGIRVLLVRANTQRFPLSAYFLPTNGIC